MTVTAVDAPLSALLASRICHDLISPVGAIGNGVELMRELRIGGEELDLIGQSAGSAAATLQFYRIAFGAASPGDAMPMSTVQRTVRAWFAHQRAELLWADDAGEAPRAAARLLCNLLQIASAALARGGTVAVDTRGEDGLEVRVTAEGPMLRLPEEAQAWLSGRTEGTEPAARDVQYLAAHAHAAASGAAIDFWRDEGRLTLVATIPAGA